MKKADYDILNEFYSDCVRFWHKELKLEPDSSKEPYLNALDDIKNITYNPFIPFPKKSDVIDKETKNYFIKKCEMDIGLNKDFAAMKWIEEES